MNAPYSPEGHGEPPVQAVAVNPYPMPPAPAQETFHSGKTVAGIAAAWVFRFGHAEPAAGGRGNSRRRGNAHPEQYFSHEHRAKNKVAILSIEGIIGSGDGFFKRQLDQARKDYDAGELKALVLRVNSPGGTINGSDYMLHHLRKFKEDTENKVPIVVSMGRLRPAADITSRWRWATSRIQSLPSRPPIPARSA